VLSISRTTASAASELPREVMITSVPDSASASAAARPRPRLPPVMSAMGLRDVVMVFSSRCREGGESIGMTQAGGIRLLHGGCRILQEIRKVERGQGYAV